jgi:hypothetical protein
MLNDDDLRVRDSAGAFTVCLTNQVTAGNWHYFAFVWNETHLVCTVDETDGTPLALPNVATVPIDIYIGKRHDDVQFFDGLLDNIKLYDRALTTQEKRAAYNLGFGYYDWLQHLESTFSLTVNASDSYTNQSATGSVTVDYTHVTLLNETDRGRIDDPFITVQFLDGVTFEELNSTSHDPRGIDILYKDIDSSQGERRIFRADGSSVSNFSVPREVATVAYAIGEDFTIYMPRTSTENVGFYQFKVVDFTEDWSNANVRFRRTIDGNLITLHETFVDVENKATVYLIQDAEVEILVNRTGDTRLFGFFKPTHSSITTVLEVELNMANITEWLDRQFLNKDINFTFWVNGTSIFFGYDNIGTTSTLEFWVFNGSNRSEPLFYSSSNGSNQATFTYAVGNVNDTHFARFCANNSEFGYFCKESIQKAGAFVVDWFPSIAGPRVPDWGETVVAISIILVLAGIFGGIDSKTGGLVVAGAIVFFSWINWLDFYSSQTREVTVLGLVVFMAVLNKMTEGAT